MKNKPIRELHLEDGTWKYKTGSYYVTVWSPRDKKGSDGTQIHANDLRTLNEAEGRQPWAYTPGCVKAAIEVFVLKKRQPAVNQPKKCSRCGKVKQGVMDRRDPFSYEINGETIIAKMCEDCYDDRAMEI
jgi:hypothetical protein